MSIYCLVREPSYDSGPFWRPSPSHFHQYFSQHCTLYNDTTDRQATPTLLAQTIYLEVIAQLVLANIVVVGQLHHEMLVLGPEAHHGLAPLA